MRQKICLLLVGLLVASAAAGDVFTKSDDYKEGEEVVGKFLKDEDYKLMVDDVERNEVDFDWLWVKTADGKLKSKVKNLGFDLAAMKTISIPEVKSLHKGMIPAGFADKVRESLVSGAKELGLEVVASGGEVELAAALVDYKQDSTFVYFGNVKPFIELEMKLTAKSGEVLARIRHQAHGDSAETAGFNLAERFVRFFR